MPVKVRFDQINVVSGVSQDIVVARVTVCMSEIRVHQVNIETTEGDGLKLDSDTKFDVG